MDDEDDNDDEDDDNIYDDDDYHCYDYPNSDINSLWVKTSFGCNAQYDQYKNKKQILTAMQKDNESRITRA